MNNIDKDTLKLINEIERWIEITVKKDFIFTEDSQYKLDQMLKILNKHIDMLVDFEIKRKEKERS